jgi:hypothetical protein
MKLLMENWRKYLTEGKELFGYEIQDNEKVFVSPEAFEGVRPVTQKPSGFKPTGLWYSCGDEWVDWLESEMPSWLNRVNYLYRIEVNQERILTLRNPKDFEFIKDNFKSDDGFGVNWKKIQDEGYAGIEICPWQSSIKWDFLNYAWYGGWDVASGCIWDPAGIKGFKLIAQREGELSEGRGDPEELRKDISDYLNTGPQKDGSPYENVKKHLKGKKKKSDISAPPGAPGGGSIGHGSLEESD